jgi:cytochrome b subunit of formate dehydrogenase
MNVHSQIDQVGRCGMLYEYRKKHLQFVYYDASDRVIYLSALILIFCLFLTGIFDWAVKQSTRFI